MKHTVRRHVSDEEQRLWEAVKDAFQSDESVEQVNTTRITHDSLPMHETRARQVVRSWDNDGLVKAIDNANIVLLTEYGGQVDTIEQMETGGESWR